MRSTMCAVAALASLLGAQGALAQSGGTPSSPPPAVAQPSDVTGSARLPEKPTGSGIPNTQTPLAPPTSGGNPSSRGDQGNRALQAPVLEHKPR